MWDETSFHREMPIDQFLDYLNSSEKNDDVKSSSTRQFDDQHGG